MIQALTLWLIRHTCTVCGKATRTRHWHTACKRSIIGGA